MEFVPASLEGVCLQKVWCLLLQLKFSDFVDYKLHWRVLLFGLTPENDPDVLGKVELGKTILHRWCPAAFFIVFDSSNVEAQRTPSAIFYAASHVLCMFCPIDVAIDRCLRHIAQIGF